MAKLRCLKKDVNFLAFQVKQECFSFMEYSPPLHLEEVIEILEDAEVIRRDLLARINQLPRTDKIQCKQSLKAIVTEMYDKNIALIDRLNTCN